MGSTLERIRELMAAMKGLSTDMKTPLRDRQVAREEDGDLVVSTVEVNDLLPPFKFETAVSHPKYNDGHYIPVERYETRSQAEAGHLKWLDTMRHNPPVALQAEVDGHIMSKMLNERGNDLKTPRSDAN